MAEEQSKNLETCLEKLHLFKPGWSPEINELELRGSTFERFLEHLHFNVLPQVTGAQCRHSSRRRRKLRESQWNKTTHEGILRPARLKLSSLSKNSIRIRPSKLNVITKSNVIEKKPKRFLPLKPATLIIEDERQPLKSSKINVSKTSLSDVPFSVDQGFSNDKLKNQKTFQSLRSTDDADISGMFDTLSFQKLRQTEDAPSPEVAATTNKCENTSSSPVQTITESCAPDFCDDNTSIEELSSYFDLFVHIPKKMSSMAEMMYI